MGAGEALSEWRAPLSGCLTDTFTFHGTIRRNVLYGSYQRDDAHNLAGTGTFVLKIVAHSRAMEGQCLWYDGGLDAVWASGYGWRRAE